MDVFQGFCKKLFTWWLRQRYDNKVLRFNEFNINVLFLKMRIVDYRGLLIGDTLARST